MKLSKISIVLLSFLVFSCNTSNEDKSNKAKDNDSQNTSESKVSTDLENSSESRNNGPELYEIEETDYCYAMNGKAEFYFTKTETGTISGRLTIPDDEIDGIFTGEFRRNVLLGTLKRKDSESNRIAEEMIFLKNDSDHTLTEGIGEREEINGKKRFTNLDNIKYNGRKFTEKDCSQLKSYRGY